MNQTRTITVKIVLDFGLDAEAAHSIPAEQLELCLLEAFAVNGVNDLLQNFAIALQAERVDITYHAEQE